MISKVVGGSGFAGVLSYVSEKGGATLLATSGVFALETDAKAIAGQMRANADQRNLKKPIMHVSLALKPGERASDEQWRTAAKAYLQKMGFDLDKSQYALYRHADRDHDHVHLIVNRVQLDGKVISDSHERRRSHEATRAAEKAAGLTLLEKQSEAPQRGRMHELRQAVDRAITGNPDLAGFKQALEQEGIKLIENRSQTTGKLSGISFQDAAVDGKTWKASALGKDYSLSGLEKRGLETGREPVQKQQQRSGPAAPRPLQAAGGASSMAMPAQKVDANKLRSGEQLAKSAAADAKAESKRVREIERVAREEEYE